MRCEMAIDGLADVGSEWASLRDGADSWIEITFADTYRISLLRLMSRVNGIDDIEEATVSFSDGSTQTVILLKSMA